MSVCGKCGKPLKDGALFCVHCGEPVTDSANQKKMQMRCSACGAAMELSSENEQILFCPFCGSKEMILESDAVIVEKDRNRTYKEVMLDEHKTVREIELERFRHEREMAKSVYDEEGRHFRRGAWSKITFVLMAFYAFGLSLCFTGVAQKQGRTGSLIIAVIQLALCALTFLMGSRVIRHPISRAWPMTLAISFALIFVYIVAH